MIAYLEIGYLLSTLSFITGLKFMSHPKKANLGNKIAALGMILAVVISFFAAYTKQIPSTNLVLLLVALGGGAWIGRYMSKRVAMTEMPQFVSLFNATGGGCAMLLGIVEGHRLGLDNRDALTQVLIISTIVTGALAAIGSMVAYGKLAGITKDQKNASVIYASRVLLASIILFPVLYHLGALQASFMMYLYLILALSLFYGFFFVLPIGGADMPVVISLLNAVTGISTALTGFVGDNKIMMAGGIFVGAAGILLTFMMCKAMNRSLFKVLAGTFKKAGNVEDKGVQVIQEISLSETALQMSFARKIAIVPGYGMAVAQAQHVCAQIQQYILDKESELNYIIHPVAGRMPGHMNVLLAEANIDYQFIKEMDEGNEEMSQYDLVLVIGANDVVNPAAINDENSSVYGMPIISVHQAKKVVVLKRSMNTGYAGVRNDLFDLPNCSMLFGDAKTTLEEILKQLKMI
ncbi:MAG: NAD(P)(+) transhydrogenase (Re/Si-specific) subunit beta [Bacteroidetes bacterium]|nr:NAD(P)(+) transhydrogenase (Re/Si-specific) subunit beta [Bacteroidota bacterium]